jgi:predicted AAA+ superfamily ATPase
LLDEIQEIKGWEKAINELFDNKEYDVDIYLTGSNSRMLSSEISTYLTGRYVRFEVLPLSFSEYLYFTNNDIDTHKAFIEYLHLGGFPIIHANDFDIQTAYTTVLDIYKTVVFTDIVKRNSIRNIDQLERIVKYVIENIGNTFSAKSISDYLKNQNRKIDIETIYNYLSKLENAFILYRCSRYDIKGKERLKTQEKFYLSDIALKYSLVGYQETGVASSLENIVYLELRRRGYTVYVGKLRRVRNRLCWRETR